MDMEGLTGAYTLTRLTVSPNQLLLDPMNPRLITEASQERQYTSDEIRAVETQRRVLQLVCSKEHDVKRLISSIREMGFIGGLREIIVKEVAKGGPYLVIEGNRRTAALQHLFGIKATLPLGIQKSIEKIEVKLFQHSSQSRYDESTVIDALLGSIHIDGPKEWGALERANYVNRSYLRTLGTDKPFRFDNAIARQVGSTFKLSAKAVQKNLVICRVYEQLRQAQVGVEPKHFTLIDLATKTRAVAEPYFELDQNSCRFSQVGIERFAELTLGRDAPVHNPKLFDVFVEIFSDGTPLEVRAVVTGTRDLIATRDSIRRRKEQREFRDNLEIVKENIKALYVDDFRGTEGEKALIRRIQDLVERRLVPLLKAAEG